MTIIIQFLDPERPNVTFRNATGTHNGNMYTVESHEHGKAFIDHYPIGPISHILETPNGGAE